MLPLTSQLPNSQLMLPPLPALTTPTAHPVPLPLSDTPTPPDGPQELPQQPAPTSLTAKQPDNDNHNFFNLWKNAIFQQTTVNQKVFCKLN